MNDSKNPIEAIEKWSLEIDKKWLKDIVDRVLRVKRELTDQEVLKSYHIFVEENNLDENKNESNIEDNIETITKSISTVNKFEADDSIKKIVLKKLSEVENVNALIQNQKILFHPKLTIIFGYNATGKSGYVKILKRVSKSRTSEDIWSNIHSIKEKNIGKAKFIVDIDDKEKEILWNGESEVYPLVLIDVFDNKCVKVFLTDELTFGFKPYGFELFLIISNAINQLKEILQNGIFKRKQVIDLSVDFNEDTKVFKMIEQMSPDTSKGQIETFSNFSDDDLKKLENKNSEKSSLSASNIADKIKIINNEKKSLKDLKNILINIKEKLSETIIKNYSDLVKKYLEAKKNIENKKESDLTGYQIPLQGSREWDDFIQSAEEYIKILPESDKYPSVDYKCIYCRKKLSEEAIILIKRYRALLKSQEEETLKKYEKEVEEEIQILKEQSFSLSNISEIEPILNVYDKLIYTKIKAYCNQAEIIRNEFIDTLTNKEETENTFTLDKTIDDKLVEIIDQKELFIAKLKGDESERNNKIEELNTEINELTDRKTLKEKKGQVLKYLEDLKWVKKAEELYRLTTTRPVTDLSKKVWENLITDEFKRTFNKERGLLKAPTVEFMFPGEHGVQKRSKSLAGMKNIDDFLSEGEQKAIALADFLAEISLKPINTPIVFDDPVTSFDHIRRKAIAERLWKESQQRQVIIFTHDILFLSYLKECCKNECDVSLHWMQKEKEGVYGKISLNDCPMLDSFKDCVKKVENSIQKIQTLSGSEREDEIVKAFDYLRASYESFVIDKIFRKIIRRWSERIQMFELKYVVYDEELLIEVQDKFEELSQYIGAHTHSDIIRQDSLDETKLEKELEHLKELAKDLKDKQNMRKKK